MKKPKPEVAYPCAIESTFGVEIKLSAAESVHVGIYDAIRLASELTAASTTGLKRIIEHVVTKENERAVFPKNANRTH